MLLNTLLDFSNKARPRLNADKKKTMILMKEQMLFLKVGN